MYKLLLESLVEWNQKASERVKLQYSYVASAALLIIAAGLIGMLNYDLGQRLTAIALLALGIFLANLVVWTLLDGIVFSRLRRMSESKKPAPKPTARTTRK